jgi:hypothetical protein
MGADAVATGVASAIRCYGTGVSVGTTGARCTATVDVGLGAVFDIVVARRFLANVVDARGTLAVRLGIALYVRANTAEADCAGTIIGDNATATTRTTLAV